MAKYLVSADLILDLDIEAATPEEAVRLAKNTPYNEWRVAPHWEHIDVTAEDGEEAHFDPEAVERLAGRAITATIVRPS